MNMIQFFLAMNPPTVTAQMHRIVARPGKPPMIFDSPALADARAKLTAYLAQHRPENALGGAIRLVVKWCYAPRGKWRTGQYRTTKPDTDNLQKLLKDCMTAVGFWRDDAQVASEIVEKFWSDVPGIFVQVEQIEEDTTK